MIIVQIKKLSEFKPAASSLPSHTASAAPRADEEEPGGSAQGAGGEEARLRGGEGDLGDPAEAGAAETGGLQVPQAQRFALHQII